MKKLFTIALSIVLTFSLAACGCQAKDTIPTTVPTTTPTTTAPTTAATTVPTTTATLPMDPTVGTNIPDPTVESNSTDSTDVPAEDTLDATEEMDSRIKTR